MVEAPALRDDNIARRHTILKSRGRRTVFALSALGARPYISRRRTNYQAKPPMSAPKGSGASRSQRQAVRLLAGFVIVGGMVVVHVLTANHADASTGVLLILDHLFSVALVLGVFAIAAGVGGRLLEVGGLRMDGPVEALLFWTAVGLGALATAILGAGLLFGVGLIALLAPLAGATWLGRRELRQVPSLVAGTWSCLRAQADRFSLFIFIVIALFLITGALAPPTDWDALMYHLRVPEQFLRGGVIYLPEDNPHTAFVGLPHMLYLPLLAVGSQAGPALVSALCTLGLALAAFAFSLRFLDERTAGFSLPVLWGSTILVLVAISPRIDTILAFYLFLVHWAVIRAMQSQDPRFLYLGAALGGMAFGVKYNALIYLAALAPLGAWVVMRQTRKRSVAVALIAGLAFGAAFPWLLKNALLLGDPVYPFLSGRRLDPWLARLYGAATVPPQVDPAAFDLIWQAQSPFNLVDLFTAPNRITVEGEGAYYYPNFLLLLLPLWLLFLKNKVLGWLAGPALAYVVLVVLSQPTTSLRYLIPAVVPLTLVAIHTYALGWDRLASARWVRILLRATTLIVLTVTAGLMHRRLTRGRLLEHALGLTSRTAFLSTQTGAYGDAVSFVNERLPKQSRVLMLFEARGYYFRVPVLQDNGIMNWALLSAKAASPDCLRSAGITHVLLNRGAHDYYARRGLDVAPLRLDSFERFAKQCLDQIYSNREFTILRVRGAVASESARTLP